MQIDLSSARLAERNADGFVLVQPDPYGTADEGSAVSYEAFLSAGTIARSKDPTNGTGANLLVFKHGHDVRVLQGHDPRWMSILPDFGDGGAALYATTELSGTKVTPFIGFFGEGGALDEGTFKLSVPTSNGTTSVVVAVNGSITTTVGTGATQSTVTQNAVTGETIITVGTTTFRVKTSGIEAGAAGGFPVMIENGTFAAWVAALTTAGASVGLTVPPLVVPVATLVKAT